MTSKLIQDGQEKTFALVFDAGEEVVAGGLLLAAPAILGFYVSVAGRSFIETALQLE